MLHPDTRVVYAQCDEGLEGRMDTRGDTAVNVAGHQIDLPDGRSVFLGRHQDAWFLRFIATDGRETKVRLSDEAMSALIGLHAREHLEMTGSIVQWRNLDGHNFMS